MKVFAIGLSRTGTTSLHAAAVLMGLSSIHYPVEAGRRWLGGDFSPADSDPFEVVTDIPTPAFFRELDAAHPGARFVLTLRDVDAWLASLEAHYARAGPSSAQTGLRDLFRVAVFGIAGFHRQRLAGVFARHAEAVLDHFKDRPRDLLVLDFACETDPWDRLGAFLGRSPPAHAFPHLPTPYLGPLSAVRPEEVAAKGEALRALITRS